MNEIREVVSLQRRNRNAHHKRPVRHGPQHEDLVASGASETLKILEPSCKKITSIESQRVMAVLTDSIQKIQFVTVLSEIIRNLPRFKVALGDDLVKRLLHHKALMTSFEELKVLTTELLEEEESAKSSNLSESTDGDEHHQTTIAELPGQANDSMASFSSDLWKSVSSEGLTKAEVAVNNLQILADEIQFSCRNMLRSIIRNPTSKNIYDLVLKDFSNRSRPAKRLLSYLNKLQGIIKSRLLMTSKEEWEKNKYVSEVFERERRNNRQIERLQKSLDSSNDEMQTYIKKKNEVIRKIQDELDHVENQADEHYRRTRTEAEKQIVADLQMNESRVQRLQSEKKSLEQKLQYMILEHRESELDIRKRKFKTETELENWIHKYDYDMDTRNTECEEIESVYVDERVQLKELEDQFKVMETEYTTIVEERRLKEEAETRARLEFAEHTNAARIIQRFWKRYGSPPKKKKKKGGGKNKKKK